MAVETMCVREYGAKPLDGSANPLLLVITETVDLDTGACVRKFTKPDGTAERPDERKTFPTERLSQLKRQIARDALQGVDPAALTQAGLQAYLRNRAIADGLLT